MDDAIKLMLNPQPLPPKVRVHLDAKVLGDFEQFTQVQKSVLDRLGCGGCTSGYDIEWLLLRDYAVGPDLAVREIGPVGRFG